MAESIAILATVEERSQLDVFYDISNAGSEEAQEFVKDIYGQKKLAGEALQEVRRNFSAFPLGQAIDNAISLQEEGKAEDAIEKWRSIANIAEGIDNDLAAHAWFSVGYLLSEGDVEDAEKQNIQEVVSAYDRVLELDSDVTDAYYNRGIAKINLGQHESAIADFDRVLELDSDVTDAYNNRGIAKNGLGQYESAIADFDRAIELDPDTAAAYNNRGTAKSALGQVDEARIDFETALDMANKSGDTDLSTLIEQQLQVLMSTVSRSDSIRKTKDLRGAQLVYDSAGETPFVPKYQVTRPPIQPELST